MSKTAEQIFNEVANKRMIRFSTDLFDSDFRILKSVIEEAMNAYADQRVSEALSSQWVSVKERLPEKDFEMYLVWNTRRQEGFEHEIQGFINKFTHGVTHWQPLPSPPLNH